MTGNVRAVHWDQKAKAANLFYIKGIVENLMNKSGIKNVQMSYDTDKITWKYKNKELCIAYPVDAKRLNEFEVKQNVFFAAINWDLFTTAAGTTKIKYQEVPKHPAVQRDLAIILNKEVTYQQVQQATEQLKIEALRDFDLFDVFESEKLGGDKKSYALSYTFQLQDRTLTDTEIDQLMSQLMNTYKTKLQAQIRE